MTADNKLIRQNSLRVKSGTQKVYLYIIGIPFHYSPLSGKQKQFKTKNNTQTFILFRFKRK